MLTHEKDVGSGGQLATRYLLALPHKCQAVKKCHKLLYRDKLQVFI